MNRDLLDALAAISARFYFDALERYPALLLDASQDPDDEGMVVWRVLLHLDELAIAVRDAQQFDDDRSPGLRDDNNRQEDLPF